MTHARTVTVLAAATLLAACKAEAPRQPASPDGAVAERRYTVRGEIVQLAASGRTGTEIMLRHEPIDDFADSSGRVVGMASMIMPFLVEPPVTAARLGVGDKVSVTFAIDWSGPTFKVERVERLPADAVLRFGPPRPPPVATGGG